MSYFEREIPMSEVYIYGLASMLIFFVLSTYCFSRIPEDYFPENYEFKLDPFWYLIAFLFVGCSVTYFSFDKYYDSIKEYKYFDFALPLIFACLIYVVCLLGSNLFANSFIFVLAYIMTYLQPDNFMLFPDYLEPWQDRLVVSGIILVISRGLSLLNGLGAIASLQFLVVLLTAIALSLLGLTPNLIFVMAMCYTGIMLSFCFLSWPPEKIVMNNDAWSAFGFILGCFALNLSVECSEASMFIALSYLFTEVVLAIYNRYILGQKTNYLYMNTSYYTISNDGEDEKRVVYGVLKIFIVCVFMALTQTIAVERIALPVFSVALNLWFLSILSGQTKPDGFFSITKYGYRFVKKALLPNKEHKLNKQNLETNNTDVYEFVEEDKTVAKPQKKKVTSNKTKTTKASATPKGTASKSNKKTVAKPQKKTTKKANA